LGDDHFQVDRDGDIVADHAAVGADAEVLAVDFGGGGGAHALVAPGILDGGSGDFHIENGFLGDALDGEIASDFELTGACRFYLLGLEGEGGVLGYVEK